jgi:hypothetical protein
MISSASSLLEAFIQREAELVKGVSMPHMPTLGSAYEAITKDAIDQAFVLPPNLDLRIVSGFISVLGEMRPGQMDCMLVHGDGMRYGRTDQFIYPIEQVLCVIEVKKTLRRADLEDAIRHLSDVRRSYANHFEAQLLDGWEPKLTLAQRMFAQITGAAAPYYYYQMHDLPLPQGMLFYSLVQETNAPVTIIHSYGGYKTEAGLRAAFLDLFELDLKGSDKCFSVPSFPALITSNEFSLVKSNGLPFTVMENNTWVILSSTRHNAARMILEALWSKIGAYFSIKMPFDDGLAMERVHPLLLATPTEVGSQAGWSCRSTEPKESQLQREDDGKWSPPQIGRPEMGLLHILMFRGGHLELTADLGTYIEKSYAVNFDTVIANLIDTREFMLAETWLRPVGPHVSVLEVTEEVGYISSDQTRFDAWCDANKLAKHFIHLILPA